MASPLAFIFGLLGNIVSFMVFLAPMPTFYKVYKRKSTEGFQSIPYVIGLFSAMLWIYYAFLKANTTLLITINTFGCFIQTFFISIFLFYAPKKAKMETMKMIVLLIVAGFGVIVMVTQFLVKESNRAQIVGWICLIFSLCVFVAPLCILRKVIKSKSVEYMPFLLSLFLTLSAVMWFFYGLLLKDFNIAIPNVLGFAFGIIQMVLYMVYKDKNKTTKPKLPETQKQTTELQEQKIPEPEDQIADIVKLGTLLQLEKISVVSLPNTNGDGNGAGKNHEVPRQAIEHTFEILAS